MTNHLPMAAHDISENLAYILGVMQGDGSLSGKFKSQILLGTIDKDFALSFKTTLESWAGIHVGLTYSTTQIPIYITHMTSIEAAKFLDEFNIFQLKDAPPLIKSSFLRGMYDSEGSVGSGKSRHVSISNTDISLLKFCQQLLLDLGIKSRPIRDGKSGSGIIRGKKVSSRKICYRFFIVDKCSIELFTYNIGFSIKRKQRGCEKLLESYLSTEDINFFRHLSPKDRVMWRDLRCALPS